MSAPDTPGEAGRPAALRRLDVLDTASEAQFDKIVGLVRTVLGVPIATVTLVDEHRQWFKALADPRVANSPLVVGGEEFAILLAETAIEPALVAIKRLRQAIAATPFDIGEGEPLAVTASFGLAGLGGAGEAATWLARADAALHRAKGEGRNRTVPARDDVRAVA